MTSTEIANASKIMLGTTEAIKMYIGSTVIWEPQVSVRYDAEIEYLESTGTLYINTGIMANPGEISFEVDCTIENRSGSSVYTVGGLHYVYYASDGGIRTGGTNNVIAYTPGNRITITASYDNLNRRTITIGDTVITGTAYNAESGEFVLLRIPKESNCIGKLYSAKVYLNSILVRNMIPVRIGLVGYMYDKVSGQLFGNSGTGSFILGRDKLPTGYTELEYISSSSGGNLYIDLGIKLYETLNTDYDIAMKFNIASGNANQAAIFACQDSDNDPWPGTFVRVNSSSGKVIGRYIGGTAKDNTLGNLGADIELPVQTSPNKNVTSLNNNNSTHQYGTSLFCAFIGGTNTPARYCNAKLYYFKLFIEGALVRDLIPCKNSNNVVGMYDVVNNVFYTSPNGNAFVAGPAV